jgi:peroxiredoxin
MLILALLTGIWQGILSLPAPLPFNFTITQNRDSLQMIIHNAEERIVCNDLRLEGDSLFVKLPLYDSEFKLRVNEKIITGVWINYARKGNPEIPFTARHGVKERFETKTAHTGDLGGKWETWFDTGTPDSSLAIGIFSRQGNKVTGTFLTESGDHRFLEGVTEGDSLKLSVFDGFFCRLYLAEVKDGKMEGMFYSGNHHRSPFRAVLNEKIKLRNADAISIYEGVPSFTLPDIDSNIVSLNDEKFKGKVIILQIMGTWCPNCMDESEFLSEYYIKNKHRGFDIIGISFERTTEFSKAAEYLNRVKNRFNITYPLLYAGTTGKESISKVFPGLKNFSGYPSTIYLDRQGKVVKVHTGFNGPATGIEYDKFREEFYSTMEKLLK